jgi:hypothetical protein
MTPRPLCPSRRRPTVTATAVLPSLLFLLCLLPGAVHAQTVAEDWCREVRRDQHCEVRQLNAPMTGREFTIDVGANGSIEVVGYSGSDVRVTARLVARAQNERAARELAQDVEIRLAQGALRATGPRTSGRTGWSVSVRVQVPAGTAIDARTTNGAVTISATNAPVQARTTNGSIRLTDVAGRADARSTNGTIRAALASGTTSPEGVQLRTTNGSIHLVLPEHTSARVHFSTTNGSINTQLPIQVQGRISRRQLSGVLGSGGPEIRASTTNGSIHITSH